MFCPYFCVSACLVFFFFFDQSAGEAKSEKEEYTFFEKEDKDK